jgi:hypothetical protein
MPNECQQPQVTRAELCSLAVASVFDCPTAQSYLRDLQILFLTRMILEERNVQSSISYFDRAHQR